MRYRACFKPVYSDPSAEFSAPNNKAALKVYKEFCRQMRGYFPPAGLFRIRQREIVTRVTRLKKRS